MHPDLRIRPVAGTDYAQWLELWDGYNAFYGRAGATALPADITQKTWARFQDPNEPVHALVAEAGDRLVGIAHYIFHRSTIAIGPSCYLQDLFTAQTQRGTGVGRALIEALYTRAREAGAARVYWQTRESNVTARQLYDKLAETSGFIVYNKPL